MAVHGHRPGWRGLHPGGAFLRERLGPVHGSSLPAEAGIHGGTDAGGHVGWKRGLQQTGPFVPAATERPQVDGYHSARDIRNGDDAGFLGHGVLGASRAAGPLVTVEAACVARALLADDDGASPDGRRRAKCPAALKNLKLGCTGRLAEPGDAGMISNGGSGTNVALQG